MVVEIMDRYLATCVRNFLRSETLPPWPGELIGFEDHVAARMSFHGITLILWEATECDAQWPGKLRERMRQEATAQTFWEQSHYTIMSDLIEALAEAGIEAALTKGTAIAYSLYPCPAWRRRGDSDIVVFEAKRGRARNVLRRCGFHPVGDRLTLQEVWRKVGRDGFVHLVDLHWRINASSAISRRIEHGGILRNTVSLPALSPCAKAVDPLVNLVLVCINRRLHELHGYISRDEKIANGDRLIWAVDMHFICSMMSPSDWKRLTEFVHLSGSAVPVRTGLEFAHSTLGVEVPREVTEDLSREPGAADLNRHLETVSAWERLRLDIAASASFKEKVGHLKSAVAPGPDKLRERFPDLADWPIAALRARRLFEAGLRMIRGRG